MRVACLATVFILASAAPAASADGEPLVLGVFPRHKATETTTMYTPLAEHLTRHLGRKVTLVTSKDFESFWPGVSARRYDIVHYNQYHYVRSAQDYTVVAHAEEFGKDAVAGALFVRKDSGITRLEELRGRTIVFGGGRDAMLSYIAPMFLLMQAGLNEADFRSEFAVNPPNTLLALYHRQADAAGGGDILIDLPPVKNAIDAGELKVLAATEPLLFLPWAVKRTLPAKTREAIQSILVELDRDAAGRGVLKAARTTRLRKAQDRDYNPHRKMIDAVFGKEQATR
jgi:phosphonate transport system substrate-binding protein